MNNQLNIIDFDNNDLQLIFDYIDTDINTINTDNTNNNDIDNIKKLKKKRRQNNINEAARRTRLKKKRHMELMSDHIKNLHILILSNNNKNYTKILNEINKFQNDISI
jgi:hypothetical protein